EDELPDRPPGKHHEGAEEAEEEVAGLVREEVHAMDDEPEPAADALHVVVRHGEDEAEREEDEGGEVGPEPLREPLAAERERGHGANIGNPGHRLRRKGYAAARSCPANWSS